MIRVVPREKKTAVVVTAFDRAAAGDAVWANWLLKAWGDDDLLRRIEALEQAAGART